MQAKELANLLQNLGIAQDESKVYLAALELGEGTMQEGAGHEVWGAADKYL